MNRLALELPSPQQVLYQTLKLDLLTEWSLEKWVRSRLSFPELCADPIEHEQLLEAATAYHQINEGAWLPATDTATSAVASTGDAVQRLYTENPYPVWRVLGRSPQPRPLSEILSSNIDPPIEVLIAGCGTGQHALQTASRLSDARVWAIDISATSISYAKSMGNRFPDLQVRWQQADLFRIPPTFPQRYHLIESIGVLQHLSDPMAGLRHLASHLLPGGWMRLGLYSQRAREPLKRFQRIANSEQWPCLVHLREHLCSLEATEDFDYLTQFRDFYSLSGLRDLLLHPREIEFTPKNLLQFLQGAGMQFMGFDNLAEHVQAGFQKECGSQAIRDLLAWEYFEQKYPRTFKDLYVFWCRPTGSESPQ